MLHSIREVNEEFFKKFSDISVLVKGKNVKVPIRYARKSSKDYTEETSQYYPCIAIQDYTPRVRDDWYLDTRPYFEGLSEDEQTGFLFRRPIWFSFRYDVSIVSKGYFEYTALKDLFLEKFGTEIRMVFNERLSGEDFVGDIVPYTVRESDIPRTDGVFETNYEFECSVWVTPNKPVEVDAIRKVIVNGGKG